MIYKRSGLAILAVAFFGVLLGTGWLIGMGGYYKGPLSKLVGGILLLVALTVLAKTARRWAGYLFAACALAAIKAGLALVFGVTISSGHIRTDYPLVTQMFVMLVALSALTLRFAYKVPRSKLDVVALVSSVVAIESQILEASNFWPVRAAALLLAISWIVDWRAKRSFSNRRHQLGQHSELL